VVRAKEAAVKLDLTKWLFLSEPKKKGKVLNILTRLEQTINHRASILV
jgi:hypothetical protein